jgi:hypothetical protein
MLQTQWQARSSVVAKEELKSLDWKKPAGSSIGGHHTDSAAEASAGRGNGEASGDLDRSEIIHIAARNTIAAATTNGPDTWMP